MSSQITDLGYPFGQLSADQPNEGGSPYPAGECTDYVWRYFQEQEVDVAPDMGNATEWGQSAQVQGYTIYNTPKANTIAWWSSSEYPDFGHVAVVVATSPLTVQEFNFAYPIPSDGGAASNAGRADKRVVAAGDPQPLGYILPTGAGIGAGDAEAIGSTAGESIAQGLAGLTGVANAIDWVALQAQVEAMNLQNKVQSGAQIGLGSVIAAGGAGVIALSAMGKSPTAVAGEGVKRVRSKVTRRQIAQHFPDTVPQPEPGAPTRARTGELRAAAPKGRASAARIARSLPRRRS